MSMKFIKSLILLNVAMVTAILPLSGCGKAEKKEPYLSDSFSTVKWPDSALAKLLPTPESTSGMIETDRADLLEVCPPRKNRQKTYAKNRMKRMTNNI